MNLSDFQAVKTIIVHDNCADGLASAILLHDVLPDARIQFVQYGTAEYVTLKAEPNMLFADFAPSADRADEFVKAGALILDHHKGSKAVIDMFGDRAVFGDEIKDPGVCGAVLAYREVWLPLLQKEYDAEVANRPGDPDPHYKYKNLISFAEQFVTLAGIRDTWQRKSPLWRQANVQVEVLNFMPRDRWMGMPFKDIASQWDSKYGWIGDVLLERHEKHIEKTVKGAHRFTTQKGTRVVCFDGVRASSDAAELLDKSADLVVGFGYLEEDMPHMTTDPLDTQTIRRSTKMILSTRSHTHYDCCALAKAYGGGGHTKAAGFNREISVNDVNPYSMIEALVTMYEAEQVAAKPQVTT